MDDFERPLDEIKRVKDAERARLAQERAMQTAEQGMRGTVQTEMENVNEALRLRGYKPGIRRAESFPRSQSDQCRLKLSAQHRDFVHVIGSQGITLRRKHLNLPDVDFPLHNRYTIGQAIREWGLGVLRAG